MTGADVNPQASVWPITSHQHPRPQKAMTYQLGDGGNLDNSGVLTALQRGATRVVSMINADTGLSSKVDFCTAPRDFVPSKGDITDQFAQLFGYIEYASSSEFHTHNQAFASEYFLPIACQFQRLKAAGKPQIVRSRLRLQANSWWGIPGGAEVDIMFYLLDRAYEFEDLLPQDTRQELSKGKMGGLSGFPNLKTVFQNFPDLTQYTAPQINLVSALTEWSLLQHRADLQDLLR